MIRPIRLVVVAALVLAGCGPAEPPTPVVVKTQLESLLSPFTIDPNAKVEKLPDGVTRATGEGTTLAVTEVAKRVTKVNLSGAASGTAFAAMNEIGTLIGPAWEPWYKTVIRDGPKSTKLGDWSVTYDGRRGIIFDATRP